MTPSSLSLLREAYVFPAFFAKNKHFSSIFRINLPVCSIRHPGVDRILLTMANSLVAPAVGARPSDAVGFITIWQAPEILRVGTANDLRGAEELVYSSFPNQCLSRDCKKQLSKQTRN